MEKPGALQFIKDTITAEELPNVFKKFNRLNFTGEAGILLLENNVDVEIVYKFLATYMENPNTYGGGSIHALYIKSEEQYKNAVKVYHDHQAKIREEERRLKYEEEKRLSRIHFEQERAITNAMIKESRAKKKEERGGLTVKEFKAKRKAERELAREMKKK